MRLSAKAKAANELDAVKAHVEQLKRHNDVVQRANADSAAHIINLERRLTTDAQAAHTAAQSIAAFKAEVLALTVANAEMRGYIGRTLEDDAVREVPDPVTAPMDSVVTTQHAPRFTTAQPLRTGPAALDVSKWKTFAWDTDKCAPSRTNPMGDHRPWHDR